MSVVEFRHLVCHASKSCLGFSLHQHHSFGKIICSLHHGQTNGFGPHMPMLTKLSSKGVQWVEEWMQLLKLNSAKGIQSDQSSWQWLMKIWRYVLISWFAHSVWPSVWGWVVGHWGCDLDPQEGPQLLGELRHKGWTPVTDDLFRKTVVAPDMLKEESGDAWRINPCCCRDGVDSLGEAVDNNKDSIVAMG